jgi:3-(methylthio)propionyl---CoA ligase
VYSHRGVYLNALGNALAFGLTPRSVYLWTLPMFHCNGWTYPWAVTAVGGTHVCLRKIDPALIFRLIRRHGVTHLCGAPVVLTALIHAPEEVRIRPDHVVEVATGGAAPPSAVIGAMEAMGFRVTHLYGLTESGDDLRLAARVGCPPASRAERSARRAGPARPRGGRSGGWTTTPGCGSICVQRAAASWTMSASSCSTSGAEPRRRGADIPLRRLRGG